MTSHPPEELDLGTQPLDQIMLASALSNHDLVAASKDQLTHKQVAKGRKGRRLKRKIQEKILNALNNHTKSVTPETGRVYSLPDLFNYKGLF